MEQAHIAAQAEKADSQYVYCGLDGRIRFPGDDTHKHSQSARFETADIAFPEQGGLYRRRQ